MELIITLLLLGFASMVRPQTFAEDGSDGIPDEATTDDGGGGDGETEAGSDGFGWEEEAGEDDDPDAEGEGEEDETKETKSADDEKPPSEETTTAEGDEQGGQETNAPAPQQQAEPKIDPGYTSELLQRAKEVGFSAKDALGAQSPEKLEKVVSTIEARLKGDDSPSQQPSAGDAAPGFTGEDFKVTLDPELHDADVVDQFKSLRDHFQGQMDSVVAQLNSASGAVQSMQQSHQQRLQGEMVQRFDDRIGALGDEYESVLGKGRVGDIGADSDEMKNRNKLYTRMSTLAGEYQRNNQPIPTEEKLFNESLASVFTEQSKSLARKKVVGAVRKTGGQIIGRGGGRKSRPDATPEQTAKANVRRFMKEHDIDGEDDDALPGDF